MKDIDFEKLKEDCKNAEKILDECLYLNKISVPIGIAVMMDMMAKTYVLHYDQEAFDDLIPSLKELYSAYKDYKK